MNDRKYNKKMTTKGLKGDQKRKTGREKKVESEIDI